MWEASNAIVNNEVFVYSGPGGESPPQNVLRVRVDPSVTSIPARAFYQRKKLSLKLGVIPSDGATIQLLQSTSPPHSGGFVMQLSHILFELLFVFTMASKA